MDTSLPTHVLSTVHVFNVLREYFPSAWQRFSTLENTANWSQIDFQAYVSIISKAGLLLLVARLLYNSLCPSCS